MTPDLLASLDDTEVLEHGRRKVNLADVLDQISGGEEE